MTLRRGQQQLQQHRQQRQNQQSHGGTSRYISRSSNNNNNINSNIHASTNNRTVRRNDGTAMKRNTSITKGVRADTSAATEMELVGAISERLDTGLNEAALSGIVGLLRAGVHPDAVVAVVTSLQQQARR